MSSCQEEEQAYRRRRNEDSDRCWTALRYTKEWATAVTPALQGPNGMIAATIEEKEEMIRTNCFPAPPLDGQELPRQTTGPAHLDVTESSVWQALHHQSTKKAPGPDRLNFHALRLLWEWDSVRIISLIRQCLRQGYHPYAWRTAKGVLRKPNKIDYTQVKSYRVISLLNCC